MRNWTIMNAGAALLSLAIWREPDVLWVSLSIWFFGVAVLIVARLEEKIGRCR